MGAQIWLTSRNKALFAIFIFVDEVSKAEQSLFSSLI